ncbi:VWA domain-containing protein [Halopseudomonas bauzanensis]|uniref:Ca-activated chloride channel family protein n=1 Tax=Halopseudomonas bauzanensis TaxID=653930 RepID=A0A1H9UPL7_9GAMM|nr:VWA domain-containing protein [Halopseudomonas bauzanensis]SES11322.1 Ca-activated chloride channel family protein [Halopseudomonas bauzanensis]SFM10704.1 Ca-activated chloride channel family protein [Halopseudomonas bauzanensis]
MTELLGLSFARPLWLLVLPPAVILLVLLYQRGWRQSGWEQLLPASLRPWLLQQHPGGSHALRFVLLGLTWTLAILALAGPVMDSTNQPRRLPDSAVVMVLDVSRNMLSDDLAPDRLQRAKHKIRTLMQDYPDSQLGLVAFAGSAHRVSPLSRDRNTLRSLLTALDPEIMPIDGQNLDQAMVLARQMLSGHPQSTSQILLLTSGLDSPEREVLASHARELGAQLAILGIGTASGAPVPLPEGGFMRDSEGRILLPRLNGQQLAAVARQHGSRYHGITVGNRDLDYLLQPLRTTTDAEVSDRHLPLDQGHWLVLLLLPLAALGARRGWLGVLLIAALLPPPAQALSWADLWQRPDQQAMQLLEQQQPAAAAERFSDPAWHAWALYQAGDYEQAATAWAALAATEPDNAEHHFNRGTAQAMAGDYQPALESYEQALTRDPRHTAARHNRGIIEALLEQLRQQQQEDASTEGDAASSGEQPRTTGSQTAGNGNGNGNGKEPTPAASTSAQGSKADATPGSTTPATGGAASGDLNNGQASPSMGSGPQREEGGSTSPRGPQQQNNNAALEQRQALQQWLREIPDDPAELLRRKFLYQHLQQQEPPR